MINTIIYFFFSALTLFNCNLKNHPERNNLFQDSIKKQDSLNKITLTQNEQDTIWISAVGDLMCHIAELDDAKKSDGSYDFSHFFDVIKTFTDITNLSFGNFETVTAGAGMRFTGYPTFNSPDEFAYAIKDAGFDVLTTANNHCLDRGFTGIERTIKILNDCGAYQTGTFNTEESGNEILIVNEKGIRLGILAYTYGTNGINPPAGKSFCVNYIDLNKIREDVSGAKNLGCDKIIVCIHWGEEYQRFPNSNQKRIADELFNMGVDIVFGSHPHVIQPMETRTVSDSDNGEKKVFIIYSMGNFISNQRKRYTDSGVIVNLQLIKNKKSNQTIIGKIDFVPTYVSTSTGSFKILPVRECLYAVENNLTDSRYYFPSDYSRLKEVWSETTNHLTNEKCEIYPADLMMDK